MDEEIDEILEVKSFNISSIGETKKPEIIVSTQYTISINLFHFYTIN